jgi:hypothetical protein
MNMAPVLKVEKSLEQNLKDSCLWTLPIVQGFSSKTRRFGNWICFRLQVKKVAFTLLGTLERGSLKSFYLKTETDPVSETCFKKKHWTRDQVHKHDSSKCNTPSSEPFKN